MGKHHAVNEHEFRVSTYVGADGEIHASGIFADGHQMELEVKKMPAGKGREVAKVIFPHGIVVKPGMTISINTGPVMLNLEGEPSAVQKWKALSEKENTRFVAERTSYMEES